MLIDYKTRGTSLGTACRDWLPADEVVVSAESLSLEVRRREQMKTFWREEGPALLSRTTEKTAVKTDPLSSVFVREQDRRCRAVCFRDDPELLVVAVDVRGEQTGTEFQSIVVQFPV